MGFISCLLCWIACIIGGIGICLKIYVKFTTGRCLSKRNLSGHVVIVTGANIGIGLETVKDLAMRNAKVIMACRNLDKGKSAMERVKQETGSNLITLKQLDLSSLASIRKFATEIIAEETRLDILVNNAGAATQEKVITQDGMETNFQANHFGPFLLTNLLLGLMQKTPKARIVNVSSAMHWFAGKTFDFDNLQSEKNPWNPWGVYGRTKIANILFTRELARRLKLNGIHNITVNALHPGAVETAIGRYMDDLSFMKISGIFMTPFIKTAEEGAQTSIHVTVASELDNVTGEYFSDCKRAKISQLAQDSEVGKKLWEISAKLVQLKHEESIVNKKSN